MADPYPWPFDGDLRPANIALIVTHEDRTKDSSRLQRMQFHDLRHTYTSLLIAREAHPKCIQAQLGHASIQTTLDRYGHLMPEMHQAEARKLDRSVFGQHQLGTGTSQDAGGDSGGERRRAA